jgi:hypothetical protein
MLGRPLSEFDDSFNVVFGTYNTSIDLLDNPYLTVNVYEVVSGENGGKPKRSDKVQLSKCSKE